MGVSVEEQITDSEKLSLLQKNANSNNSPHSTDLATGGATAGGSHGSSKRKQVWKLFCEHPANRLGAP